MKIRTFGYAVSAANLLLMVGLLAIVMYILRLNDRSSEAHTRSLLHHRLGEELRQSSEDLTKMARLYVVTAEPRFKAYYFAILGIRNGTIPRPQDYSPLYWTLAIGQRNGPTPIPVEGRRIPFRELLRQSGMHEEDIALLGTAQAVSDQLVQTELEAFAAMDGVFKDAHGALTLHGPPDPRLAQRLMFDEQYRLAKHEIMEPISRFIHAADARNDAELTRYNEQKRTWILLALAVAVLLVVGFAGTVFYTRRNVLMPVHALSRQVARIAHGDYSARNDVRAQNELANLGRQFNTMAERIGDWSAELETEVRARTQQLEVSTRELEDSTRELEARTHQLEARSHALAEREALFAAAFKTGTDSYVVVERDTGKLVEVNDAFLLMYGLTREEAIGRTSIDLDLWADPAQRRVMLDMLARDGQVRNLPVLSRRRGGELFPMLYSVSELAIDGPPLILGVIRDITERVRAEQLQRDKEEEVQRLNVELENRVQRRTAQLENANLELEAANRELEAFSYTVSHDLRAPLRAIDGFAHLLEERCSSLLPSDGLHYLSVIRGSTERMARLIDDLLTFSRLGREQMHCVPIDMTALAHETAAELTANLDRSRIDLTIGSLPEAWGDATLLRAVWMNLIDNALKFTSKCDRAVISITGSRTSDGATYTVQDNGAGFDMHYAHKLFGVFQRLHSVTEFDGTGVGLASVQRIIQRHGGTIQAEGSRGLGATFTFTLPAGG